MNRFVKLVTGLVIALMLGACSKSDNVWVPGWQTTSAMITPRAGAAAVVNDGVVYMIGGVDGRDFVRTAEYAKINRDGSLGPWQATSTLNEERGFLEAVVHDNWIYVVGGGNGENGHNLLHSVERAQIQRDGSLGPWIREKNEMVLPRRCSKITATDTAIYAYGGFGGALLDSVEHAPFLPDGGVGVWQLESEVMTMPRYVNSVKAHGNATYVIGGHDQMRGVGVNNVEWSTVTAAGGFEKWKPTQSLHVGRYGTASAGYKERIYVLGGITGTEYLDSVEKTTIQSDGELTPWQNTTPMRQPLASFNSLVYKNWIYVLGGTNRDGYSRGVEYAEINDAGDLGYWGTKAAADAYQAQQAARQAQKQQLPNEGIVRSIQHTQAYSYIQVEGSEGLVWLAGSKIDVQPGQRIRYSQGVLMSNFFSKELQREFPAVIFVGAIEKAN